MTIKEAIRRILNHMEVHRIGQYPHILIGEAFTMAIDALREKEERENPRMLTKADRIRAMSDEELAKFLIKSQYSQVSEALAIVGVKIDPEPSYKAYEETLALLQKPAQEEPHG